METILFNCCGLDVHKDFITACILIKSYPLGDNVKEKVERHFREFGTFPDAINELTNWVVSFGCRHVAMESTGIFWLPVYEELEKAYDGDIELFVVNARHMRNVPGRKTDMKDAEWIADLLSFGVLKASFIPPESVRELRQLTRYRKNIVGDICTQKNRIEKTLQMSHNKLSSVLSDIFGVSGRNLINVLIEKGQLSRKDIEVNTICISSEKKVDLKRFLTKKLTDHQRNFLKMQVEQLDSLIAHLETIEQSIEECVSDTSNQFEEAINRLTTIPGIGKTAATAIIGEIGTDMSKFKTAEEFCSWAGLSPGNNMSAGKKKAHELTTETRILKA